MRTIERPEEFASESHESICTVPIILNPAPSSSASLTDPRAQSGRSAMEFNMVQSVVKLLCVARSSEPNAFTYPCKIRGCADVATLQAVTLGHCTEGF